MSNPTTRHTAPGTTPATGPSPSERSIDCRIVNDFGLHARAAARLVHLTQSFQSDIFIEHDGNRVHGKSIMGVLSLAAAHGSQLVVIADGPDADIALTQIAALVARGFDEGVKPEGDDGATR